MSEQTATAKLYKAMVPSIEATFIARLVSAPEMRFTPNGAQVTSCKVVVSRRYQNSAQEWTEKSSFMRLTIWREAAERLAGKDLHKGDIVAFSFDPANLEARPWKGQDGEPQASLEVTVNRVQWIARDPNGTSTTPEAEATEAPAEETEIDFSAA